MVVLVDGPSIDQHLSASVKKLLLDRLNFHEAKMIDEGDQLSEKYQAINTGYKAPTLKSKMSNSQDIMSTNKKHTEIPGIPTPAVTLFNEEKIALCWKEIRKIGPGLANLGNTCFLNSVLQVLAYTPPLVNYILEGEHKQKCKAVSFCMLCELCTHVFRIIRHNPNEGAVRPLSIINKLRCIGKNFRLGRQEDAHEFLRYVVEGMQKSDYAGKPKLDKYSKETTLANAIFGGYYRSQVKCLHCQHESNTYDPMMDMNLDIKDCSSIMQALHKSVRADRLDGDNKYHCERCRKKVIAQKRGNIHKEPNVLTFQLKRFDFTQMFGGKISKNVKFPEELNVRPFMSVNQGPPIAYKLYGVLVHSGYSCNSGHYYCYVKAPNGTWYEMNDNRVCQVGVQTVLSAQAYLLFYVKKERTKSQVNVPMTPTVDVKTSKVVQPSNSLHKSLTESFMTPVDGLSQQRLRKNLTLNRSLPTGVPVSRKPTPKIIWNNEIKLSANKDVKPPEKHATPSENVKPNATTKVDNRDERSSTGNKSKTQLNSLQRLSQTYEDSEESPSNSAPSSPRRRKNCLVTESNASFPKEEPLCNNSRQDSSSKTPTFNNDFSNSVNQNTENESEVGSSKEKTPDKRKMSLPLNGTAGCFSSGNKRKTMHHTILSSSKFAKWTPVTKAPLLSRVIIHQSKPSPSKHNHSNESTSSKNHHSNESISSKNCHSNESISSKDHDSNESTPSSDHHDNISTPPLSVNSSASSSPKDTRVNGMVDKSYHKSTLATSKNRRDGASSLSRGLQKDTPSTPLSDATSSATPTNNISSLASPSNVSSSLASPTNVTSSLTSPSIVTSSVTSPSNVTSPATSPVKYFGPVLPPSKSYGRHRNDSINSEDSCVSLHSRSGDWDVRHKEMMTPQEHKNESVTKERQHAGWKVLESEKKGSKKDKSHEHVKKSKENKSRNFRKRRHSDSCEESEEENTPKKKKKKKNKKKKHRKYSDDDEDSDTSEGRNRKKKHGKYSDNDEDSDTSERKIRKKKKKKKRKHKRSSHYDSSDSDREPLIERKENSDGSNERSSRKALKKKVDYDNVLRDKHRPERNARENRNVDESYSAASSSNESRAIEGYRRAKKKDVPSFRWDDQKKKHVKSWDGSTKKNATLDYLISDHSKVLSWSGKDSSQTYSRHHDGRHKEKSQDEYDEEYDRGKSKKSRRKHDDGGDKRESKANDFQRLQDYRNYTKDSTASFRTPVTSSSQEHYDDRTPHKHRGDKSKSSKHGRFSRSKYL